MLCHDCFRLSNEKNHAWWFCLPCTTPHEVVFAKQTGYPFWPAKVNSNDYYQYHKLIAKKNFRPGYEKGGNKV
jgi:hypothetical protein